MISGRVEIDASGENVECDTGTVVTFDPGERHAVRGLEEKWLFLMLAPWPAAVQNTTTDHALSSFRQTQPANRSMATFRRRDVEEN